MIEFIREPDIQIGLLFNFISMGQLLIDRGLIHHVVDKHSFKNQYIFYRFYEDENY